MPRTIILCMMLSLSTPLKNQKLCINCKYFIPDGKFFSTQEFAKCSKFVKKNDNINHLITGNVVIQKDGYYFCSTARTNDVMCGIMGNNYIKKNNDKGDINWEEDLLV